MKSCLLPVSNRPSPKKELLTSSSSEKSSSSVPSSSSLSQLLGNSCFSEKVTALSKAKKSRRFLYSQNFRPKRIRQFKTIGWDKSNTLFCILVFNFSDCLFAEVFQFFSLVCVTIMKDRNSYKAHVYYYNFVF